MYSGLLNYTILMMEIKKDEALDQSASSVDICNGSRKSEGRSLKDAVYGGVNSNCKRGVLIPLHSYKLVITNLVANITLLLKCVNISLA